VAKDEPAQPAPRDESTSPRARSQSARESAPAAAPGEEPGADVAATTAESAATETPQADASAPAQRADEAAGEPAVTAYKPASVALGAEPGGTIFKGRVTVKGSISEPPPITPQKDAHCIGLGTVPDASLVLGKENGLGNVFVWLRKLPAGADVPPPPKEPASLDNNNCVFQPHAFVLRLGQPLLIKNSDPTGHNTHTSPLRNTAFNQLIPANDTKGIEVIYQREEIRG
jgi:hypothetical protein